jgi:hypothetical protein
LSFSILTVKDCVLWICEAGYLAGSLLPAGFCGERRSRLKVGRRQKCPPHIAPEIAPCGRCISWHRGQPASVLSYKYA